MTKHRVFYSFHYQPDSWRVSMVRNIGALEGNEPAPDNDWETVKKRGNLAITEWIDRQMKGRSCTVVLVGSHTAERDWINYEIRKIVGGRHGCCWHPYSRTEGLRRQHLYDGQ